jgi:hypothetical protein
MVHWQSSLSEDEESTPLGLLFPSLAHEGWGSMLMQVYLPI